MIVDVLVMAVLQTIQLLFEQMYFQIIIQMVEQEAFVDALGEDRKMSNFAIKVYCKVRHFSYYDIYKYFTVLN